MKTIELQKAKIKVTEIQHGNCLGARKAIWVICSYLDNITVSFQLNVDCPYRVGDEIILRRVKKVDTLMTGCMYRLKGIVIDNIYRDGKRIY